MTTGDERDEPSLEDAELYDHWVVERVRFSDTDAMGHVNNVSFVAYIESGRVDYVLTLAGLDEVGVGLHFTLRHLAVDYRRELRYPGEVRVGTRLLQVGRTSLVTGTGVFEDGRCVATAESVLVNLGEGGQPEPFDDEFRGLLSEHLT